MIGIIGYGFVGKAVANAFVHTEHVISDPAYNDVTTEDVVAANPEAIFVCLPTPTDDTNYALLKQVLDQLKGYKGITVVKSTILPHHLEGYDVVLNPEFLSRGTANEDFISPPFVLFGGEQDQMDALYDIYSKYSLVDMSKVFLTDIKTASLYKYIVNSFYATKVTFMNQVYDVCKQVDVDYNEIKNMMIWNPWIANQHIDVPGHEGRGFAGPCLPKDTQALADAFDVEILKKVLEINDKYRTS